MFGRRKQVVLSANDMKMRPTDYWITLQAGGKHRASVDFECDGIDGTLKKRFNGTFDECVAFVRKHYFGEKTDE